MSTANPSVVNVGSTEAFDKISQGDQLTVVDLWAPWCGPCQAYGPIVEQYAEQAGDDVRVVKVNVDERQDLAVRYGVRSIPTTLFIRKGDVVDRATGALSLAQLQAKASAL